MRSVGVSRVWKGEGRTVQFGDQVGEVHRLDEGKVAPVRCEEVHVLLLLAGCRAM